MNRAAWIALGIAVPLLISLVLGSDDALAGPPLLCHPIEIGDAKSLPWGAGTWDNKGITTSEAEFVSQTLDLLAPATPILVRMETIRRAAIHAAEHTEAIRLILKELHDRIHLAEVSEKDNPLALFDYGYMIAACSQMNEVTDFNSKGISGKTRKALAIDESVNPYDLVARAAKSTAPNPEMELALALMTTYPKEQSFRHAHLRNAINGAEDGSLLAKNIVSHFGRQGQTLADLRSSFGMVTGGERR